nr:hypothetical protein GCM10020092_049500 [Actinoplanes digitatis]
MQPARPASLARTAAADPWVRAVVGVAVAAILWLLYGPGNITADVLVRAFAGVFLNVVGVVSAIRLARRPGLVPAVRRFWRSLTAMITLLLVGNVSGSSPRCGTRTSAPSPSAGSRPSAS